MVEKILGITKVQSFNHYDDSQQSFKDSLKRKPDSTFKCILEQKIKAKAAIISDPYQVNITNDKDSLLVKNKRLLYNTFNDFRMV